MPKYKHNGFLHTEALLGHAWHTLQTLNKGNEHELAGEAWPRETERMIESFVSLCSPLCFLSSNASGYREKSCFLQWDSVKLINKKTWNMSSALKIATAKCAHWSYGLRKGGYKLPQCSRWIPNIFLSSLPLPISHSFSLSKTCLVYDIICLLIPPLSCCLNYYHYSTAASKPCCQQDRVELTLPAELLQSIQYLLRWGLTYSDLFKWYRDDAGYSYRLHCAP